MRLRLVRRSSPVLVLVALLVAGPSLAAGRTTTTLRVFAAASLAGAFGEIATDFERAHPGVDVQLNLAGSQQLATQMEQGARADVFASADERWMDHVEEKGLTAGKGVVFAHNRLVAIVPRTNPARIGGLEDLIRKGTKVVVGAEAVPVGRYTRECLRKLATQPGFAADYPRRVLANVVSEEENVKSVVSKVQLGEADAGFVYLSDVTKPVARFVTLIEIPEAANVIATYPIAVMKEAPQPEAARQFVDFVLSSSGQGVLTKHGLLPARFPSQSHE
jgi:molybdate transport system substrate-binding protein